ncbi:sensor domain-containing diguanylate cyclase [Pseudomonas sichuanensis]|uniref:sensor domain-containing diguanylate cyclase n=1 Tax=Pseudomonas sichuanensis TaxID=2213015 RepID=UPI002449DC7C|nr:sensor domain-containing diguanylate cyclase [Pseudomonas sichuanensis]MDH0733009.1 sensor domain-containing diguanylate cyclase [Pseudomonas sichuanensis]MDH1586110.1 sensor domain-containing diguanylate cyclase [Pseudomonas sichuanensis]MDH1595794.1 sensor domain-containing diguanylate cyclase [Pseudomonas sichuanensis]MDH1600831.1 sensor domain-containing diguanylate cyclase [Pseudomonas sichuanensis]
MCAARKQTEDGVFAVTGEGRAVALFRLVLGFMAVVMLAFVLIEGWRIWRDYRQAFFNAENAVTNLARATAQHAEDAIRQVDAITAALAERLEGDGFEHIDRPRLHALLKQQAQIMPQLHGLFVYAPDGSWVVTDQDVVPPNANNADRDYFIYHRTHADRQVRIGAVVRSRSTGDLIIPISRRLDYPDGRFAGVLLGTIKVDWFVRYYGDFKIDERGALVLAKRDGTILVRRPFVEQVIGRSLASSEIFRKYLPYASEGVAEAVAVVDGTPRLYGFRALSSYPLVVEAGLSRESIIAPWRHDMLKSLVVLVLLLVGVAGFGWVVLRQLRERIVIERALHQAHQTLKALALTDSLTGLGNRRRLDAVLEPELRRARRQGYAVALVMLDLDYFKAYNDRYGHLAGDECLRRFGGLLKQALKRPADLAVRYGGEEFTLLLPNTDAQGASQIVQEILQLLRRQAIEHAGSPLGQVSASAGIAVGAPSLEAVTAQNLMAAADAALYQAKHQGRDRFCLAGSIEVGVQP